MSFSTSLDRYLTQGPWDNPQACKCSAPDKPHYDEDHVDADSEEAKEFGGLCCAWEGCTCKGFEDAEE